MKALIFILSAVSVASAAANTHVARTEPNKPRSSSEKNPLLAPLPPLLARSNDKKDYAWDEFTHWNNPKQMIWMCRSIQTGEFVHPGYCDGLTKIDSQWPDKITPPNFRGIILDTRPLEPPE